MALATYSDLQASVAGWLVKTNLTAVIPDFIAMCEAQMSRKLRIRLMETAVSLTTVAGTATVALPSGFKQGRVLYVDDNPDRPLSYRTPEQLTLEYPYTSQGKPTAYTLEGNNIRFGKVPDAAYSVLGIAWHTIPALSVSNTTNTMLTQNPDAYLYGTLMQAAPYLKQDERVQIWAGLFDEILRNIQAEDDSDRHSGSSLQMRTDTMNP